ncbi:MAG: PrsW family intramembrane metalloprotease [Lachnospiraceae bacterium]
MLYILMIGMIPAIILIAYIYHLDSVEREPIGLLAKLFIFGGLSTIGAGLLEELGQLILVNIPGLARSSWYSVLMYFVVVAVSEEGLKHLTLRRQTWYDPNFNFRFDGIVYSISVSLGFAAFENVMYILNFGLGVAPIRAVTAIPMHCITGIFMGHYYGQAKYAEYYHAWGRENFYWVLSMLVPVLLHGFYDFAASSEDTLLCTLFLIYVVVLDIVAFLSVRRYAREDTPV